MSSKPYILSIDQGTTSSRVIIFNKKSEIVYETHYPITLLYPFLGAVEADANQIWESVKMCLNDAFTRSNISPSEIDSIGITNQRETTVVWSKESGEPVYNAIIWQSRQSLDICEALMDKKDFIHQKTGLLINPYFSASKVRYILDKIDNGQARALKGELLFGTIDTWLIYRLTHGKSFATDVSNASRSLLFNIHTLSWDEELCALFNIPMCMLANVLPSSGDFGKAIDIEGDIHICGVAGDQQAALFGQTCFNKGESKNTYGTGCFMLMNIGDKPVLSKRGLLTTVAWKINDEVTYALEGSVYIGGAAVHWLREGLGFFENSKESESLALSVNDNGGVYVVPSFVGLASPYWDDDARGAIFGLTRATTKAHITRATLEGIAFECKDVFETIIQDTSISLASLNVDGGACKNNILMQTEADLLGVNILVPNCLESTALGVSYLAGLSTGYFKNLEEIKKYHSIKKVFIPKLNEDEMKKRYAKWQIAVEATRLFK